MKISFCGFNEQKDEVLDFLKKNHPELETSINRCIYSCGHCASKPIARINGELLVGENSQDLINQILQFQNK
jgi:uncharacterized protein YuzB (UPF0349 family)